MSVVLTLEDPTSLRVVVADSNPGAGGGWRISVSPHNFLYTPLKDKPQNILGMVFRVKEKDKEDTYAKIVNAVHRWVPNPRGGLPYLEYLAVRLDYLKVGLLDVITMIEEHRVKTEGAVDTEKGSEEPN